MWAVLLRCCLLLGQRVVGRRDSRIHGAESLGRLPGEDVEVGFAQNSIPVESENFPIPTVDQQIASVQVLGVDHCLGIVDDGVQELLTVAQTLVDGLQIVRPFSNAGLEFLVDAPDFGRRALAFRNLEFQLRVGSLQGCRARHSQRIRHEPHQQDCRRNGGQSRDCLDRAGKPVDGLPDGPDLHQVRSSASHDKDCEADEHPVELQVRPLADEVQQGEWDREVRERDQRIRSDVERQDSGLPQITHPVRHESARGKDRFRVVGHRIASSWRWSPRTIR